MEIKEIADKNIWEKFITDTSPQSLFQSWNWGEVVKKSQKLWRLGLYAENKLVGIAQVNKIIAKKGIFLHVRHGPILLTWNKYNFLFLLNYLKDLAKNETAAFTRISPLIENTDDYKQFFKSFGFIDSPMHAMDGEYCWILDLEKTDEELLAGMRKTTRYLVRQAQKLGVTIVKSKDTNDIEEFLSLYKHTAKRQKFVEHKSIKKEFEQFVKDDQILLFKGYFQNKLISAALIIFYNQQAIYHHSASRQQKIPVNYLLQWEAILEAKKRKMTQYNFWGIAPLGKPRHPWKGLTIFKQGFGGKDIEYLHAKDLPYSILYCTTYIWEWIRRVRKGY